MASRGLWGVQNLSKCMFFLFLGILLNIDLTMQSQSRAHRLHGRVDGGAAMSRRRRLQYSNGASVISSPGSWIRGLDLGSGSRIQGPGSRLLDPGSWIRAPEPRILDRGSWIHAPGSRLLELKPQICCFLVMGVGSNRIRNTFL